MDACRLRPLFAALAVFGALAAPAAAPAAPADDPPAELAETMVLEGVVFEFGSAELTPESIEHLDAVALMVQADPEASFEVGGHTDSSGPADLNRDLSRRRAETVRRFLVVRGVDAGRVTAVGYGEDYPIADNATPAGRARNRRVELKRLLP